METHGHAVCHDDWHLLTLAVPCAYCAVIDQTRRRHRRLVANPFAGRPSGDIRGWIHDSAQSIIDAQRGAREGVDMNTRRGIRGSLAMVVAWACLLVGRAVYRKSSRARWI